MAFDATYLTAGLSQACLHGRRGLVGGAFQIGQSDVAFLDLESDDIDVSVVPRAKALLDFVTWDPQGRDKCPMSVCALPVEHTFRGAHATHRGCWTVLETVGTVLQASLNLVRGISFDAHTTHGFVRKCVHGQFEDIDSEELLKIPFFSDLKHQPLPKNDLPRLPMKVCMHKGDVFWAMPGPCRLDFAVY